LGTTLCMADVALLIFYTFFVSAHNFLFMLLLFCLIRVFTIKHAAYSMCFVGCYALVHSVYGGCPLLEIENYIASLLGLDLKDIGDAYTVFDSGIWAIRTAISISSIALLYSAHRQWHKVDVTLDLTRIVGLERRLRRIDSNTL